MSEGLFLFMKEFRQAVQVAEERGATTWTSPLEHIPAGLSGLALQTVRAVLAERQYSPTALMDIRLRAWCRQQGMQRVYGGVYV